MLGNNGSVTVCAPTRSAIGKLPGPVAQLAVSGEQMQGGIVHTDADPALVHGTDEIPPRDPQCLERQERGEDVPAVPVVSPRRQAHGWIGAQPLEVAGHEQATPGIERRQVLQLGQADARRHVAQVVLAAGEQHIGTTVGIAPQSVEALQLDCGQLALVGQAECAALDGGEVLVGVEAERHQVAEAADALAAPGGADGVGRILDHPQVASPGDRVKPVHVHCQPGEVHGHDRPRARRDRGLDPIEIEIAAVQLDVDEHRPGPDPQHHVGAGREGHGRHDHLVVERQCRMPGALPPARRSPK